MHVELRGLGREQRRTTVIDMYEQLHPGQGFVLVSEAREKETLAELQNRYPGQVEWHPLVDGPAFWQVLVGRADARKNYDQVAEFMTADHQRIHKLVDDLVAAAQHEDISAVANLCRFIDTGLRTHMRMEEEILLPALEQHLGGPRWASVLFHQEHITITGMIAYLAAEAVVEDHHGSDSEEIIRVATALQDLLRQHSQAEERLLYAVTDFLLNADERDQLVRRCQQV